MNIELLKNKPIDDILKEVRIKSINAEVYLLIEVFLKENNINNYYDLALLINDRENFRLNFIHRYCFEFDIFELEAYVYNFLASKVYQLEDFKDNSSIEDLSFLDYVDYGFKDYYRFASTFELTDRKNTINDLWIRFPFRMNTNLQIPNLSIYEVKNLLREAAESDNVSYLQEQGIDEKMLKILIKSLKPYTEQVIRQSVDLGSKGINKNLLKVNREEKRNIIYRELYSIAQYLVYAKGYQGGEFIFGKLTDFDKKQLELIAKGIKGTELNKRRNELVRIVADAFTLTEIRSGIFYPNEDVIFKECSSLPKTKTLSSPISRLFQEK